MLSDIKKHQKKISVRNENKSVTSLIKVDDLS
jgi:hypothetical protein